MAENPERLNYIFDELARNPHQNAEAVEKSVLAIKSKLGEARGLTSEVLAGFLIGKIQEVTFVNQLHVQIDGLDADLEVEFANAEKVYLQIKTSEFFGELFKEKVKEVNRRRKKPLRWVVLSTEKPFDSIIEDFVDQINVLEGRDFLKPVKF